MSLVATKSVRWDDTVTRNSFTFLSFGKPRILMSLPWASETDTANDSMGIAAVLATGQFDGTGKAFVQDRIVEDQIGMGVGLQR